MVNKPQGPVNPRHKKYINNDKSIINVLCIMLKSRRINIRAAELYKKAKLSSPTFYLHYRSTDDARQQYEKHLKLELAHRVPKHTNPQVFFTILVNFIAHNQQYFMAVSESCDHYLLTKILILHRKILVSRDIDERTFLTYVGNLQVVIDCWLKFDLPKEASIEKCVKELVKVKPPKGNQKSGERKTSDKRSSKKKFNKTEPNNTRSKSKTKLYKVKTRNAKSQKSKISKISKS